MDNEATSPPQLLVKVTAAAEMLSCGRTMLYQLIAKGEIHTVKLGRARRVPMDELRSYIERNRAA